MVINENSTGVCRVLVDKSESRVAGISARRVIRFNRRHIGAIVRSVVGYRSSTVWPVERVLPNRFRFSSYSSVAIGVVIAV